MKFLLISFLLLFSLSVLAESAERGTFISAIGGSIADEAEGIEQMEGSVAGVAFGYQWENFFLEMAYLTTSMSAGPGTSSAMTINKAELEGSILDFGFGWRYTYFQIFMGFSTVETTEEYDLTNVAVLGGGSVNSQGDNDYTGAYFGMGLVIPLSSSLELYADYTSRSWTNLALSVTTGIDVSIDTTQYSGGLRIFF